MTSTMLRGSLLAAAVALVVACTSREAPPPTAATGTPVRVVAVESASLVVPLRMVGIVAPRDEVRLSFKVAGVVASIAVEEADVVHTGQVLAELEQGEVAAVVRQARESASKAQRDLDRARALYADGVATVEQVQDLTTALQMARAAQNSAEFNARFTRIEAPTDGIVLRRLGEPRELVAPGQPLLVVGGTERGWVVKAAVADREVVRIHAGDAADVTLDAYPGLELAGRVTEIASAADPATGMYSLELLLPASDTHLVQGLIARVVVHDETASARPVVPVAALLEADGGQATVFVVDPQAQIAHRVAVRTGRFVGDRVEILAGIEPADRVVTEGAAYLNDGDAVRILGAS